MYAERRESLGTRQTDVFRINNDMRQSSYLGNTLAIIIVDLCYQSKKLPSLNGLTIVLRLTYINRYMKIVLFNKIQFIFRHQCRSSKSVETVEKKLGQFNFLVKQFFNRLLFHIEIHYLYQ